MTQDSTLLLNCNIIDVESGSILPNHHILIKNGRIQTISNEEIIVNDDNDETIKRVNVEGRFVLPGLIDAHVHVNAVNADLSKLKDIPPTLITPQAMKVMKDMLFRGFTTVRDAAGADWGIAKAVEEGFAIGPRIIFGGKALSPTGGHGDGRERGDFSKAHNHGSDLATICDGITEVRRETRHLIRSGAHHIKIVASGGVASPTDRIDSLQFSTEEIKAIVEEANASNIYVLAHAYTAKAINRALELGVRSIEHGNLLDEKSIELFRKYDAFLVPTLITYYALKEDGLKYGLPQTSYEKIDAVLENGKNAIKMAFDGGVKMVYGSDLLGEMHSRQLEEFKLLSEILPNQEAIKSATVTAAELIKFDNELGVIKEDAIADLLVYDANPLDDINVLLEPEIQLRLIMKNGVIYKDQL